MRNFSDSITDEKTPRGRLERLQKMIDQAKGTVVLWVPRSNPKLIELIRTSRAIVKGTLKETTCQK